MTSREEKRGIILSHEERFAFSLAQEVMESPKMSFWMIFIPIFLVYHVYQHKRVVNGRKGFVQHYLTTRKRALEDAYLLVNKGMKPNIGLLLKESGLPEKARGPFKELFTLLIDHYADLLRSAGDDMISLLRSAYRSRTNYLLFLNKLNRTETALNEVLRSNLGENAKEIQEIVRRMQASSERLRREGASSIFP